VVRSVRNRLGRDLKHLISLVEEQGAKEAGFKVLSGYGANIGMVQFQCV
jgi:hypothetical protein